MASVRGPVNPGTPEADAAFKIVDMNARAGTGGRFLPRGWGDLIRQLVIWLGFVLAYQVARGVADRNPAQAFANGLRVIDFERRTNGLFEITLQNITDSSHVLTTLASWTYWMSQFAVVGLALLWVYLRRNADFIRFRNVLLLANVIGLLGYILLPTAPPRMFPDFGFVDTLAVFAGMNHSSGIIQLAANPYAAMPSLHAADAFLVGVILASLVRHRIFKVFWALWPAWVAFCVMGTGNHFWLDIVAGVGVALVAAAAIYREPLRRRIATLS
jgi:membrane-associated phospholipid phosphatase